MQSGRAGCQGRGWERALPAIPILERPSFLSPCCHSRNHNRIAILSAVSNEACVRGPRSVKTLRGQNMAGKSKAAERMPALRKIQDRGQVRCQDFGGLHRGGARRPISCTHAAEKPGWKPALRKDRNRGQAARATKKRRCPGKTSSLLATPYKIAFSSTSSSGRSGDCSKDKPDYPVFHATPRRKSANSMKQTSPIANTASAPVTGICPPETNGRRASTAISPMNSIDA